MHIVPTTDFTLPWYDFSTLNTIAQCPRKGIISYRHNKHVHEGGTSDALLAGHACHRFFAAYNAFGNQELVDKLYTSDEQEHMFGNAMAAKEGSDRLAFALEALYQSELPDSSSAKKSPDKLEKSCIYWADMQRHGCEIYDVEFKFDITIDNSFRYVGVIDCLQYNSRGSIIPVEYKTTGRMDDKYLAQWYLSPQLTGYMLACMAYHKAGLLPEPASYNVLEAVCVPITKTMTVPHVRKPYQRNEVHFEIFDRWVRAMVAYTDTVEPWNSPVRPHSCYSYFSVCEFIDFCQQSEADRKHIFENELVERIWNPTEDK